MTAAKPHKHDLIDKITPDQAREVLRGLWNSDAVTKSRIQTAIRAMLLDVNYEKVCGDVGLSISGLSVEDVYDNSGSRRDGYHDPGEVALPMFEDACKEHIEQMDRHHELGMDDTEPQAGLFHALYDGAGGDYARNVIIPS